MFVIVFAVLVIAVVAKPIHNVVEARRHTYVHTSLDESAATDVFLRTVGKNDRMFGGWELRRTVDQFSGDPTIVADARRGAVSLCISDAPEGSELQIWISRSQVRLGGIPVKTAALRRRVKAFTREMQRRDSMAVVAKG